MVAKTATSVSPDHQEKPTATRLSVAKPLRTADQMVLQHHLLLISQQNNLAHFCCYLQPNKGQGKYWGLAKGDALPRYFGSGST